MLLPFGRVLRPLCPEFTGVFPPVEGMVEATQPLTGRRWQGGEVVVEKTVQLDHVGILFLLAIFFSPVAAMVPAYAAAGALIYVGVLMCSELTRVKWEDLTEAVPAFMTAVMMPFSFSITEGIAVGFISYCVMKAGTGRWREINPCVLVVALLFVLKFVWVDAH